MRAACAGTSPASVPSPESGRGTRRSSGVGVRCCVLLVSAFSAAVAAVAAPAGAAVGARGAASHLVAATAAAVSAGPRVEVPALRSRTADTFRNADGSFTTTVSSHSVNYKDSAGMWQPIGVNLVPSVQAGYAWANGANRFKVDFKSSATSDFARLEIGGVPVALSLIGATAAAGRAAGSGFAYDSVLPGVDLRYDVTSDDVKESLVLHDASAPTDYRFRLRPLGPPLQAEEQFDGSWVFRASAKGPVLFALAAPSATDASGAAPLGQGRVSMSVQQSGGAFTVDVAVDKAWLQDPARQFPVTVDPSVSTLSSSDDVYYPWLWTGSGPYTGSIDYVGTDSSMVYRTAIRFDLASAIPAGATITSADLKLYFNQCGAYCPAAPANVDAWVLEPNDFTAPAGYNAVSQLYTESTPAATATLNQISQQ